MKNIYEEFAKGEKTRSVRADAATPNKRERIVLNPRAERAARQFNSNNISPNVVTNIVRMIEFILIASLGNAINLLYVYPIDGFQSLYVVATLAAAFLTVLNLQITGGYEIGVFRRNVRQLSNILATWMITISILAFAAFFLKIADDISRVWFAGWLILTPAALMVFRSLLSMQVRRWVRKGRLERRAVIIGGGDHADALIRALDAQPNSDIRICGIFDDRNDKRSPDMINGYQKLGTVSELVEFGRLARIDILIVSLPLSAETRVLEMLKKVWVLPVDIRISAQNNKLRFLPRSYSYEGTVPFLDVFDKPISDWDSVLKRIFDITFASLGIVTLSPIYIATALAVKCTSKGPVLFRQKRFGFKNEVIDVMKFRSMYTDQADQEAKVAVTRGDPRVTPVGRFIRRTSIDELPQLFNVLSGELSLVGPRPHAVNAHTQNRLWDEVIDGYFGRHKVKPGVTGWAQINGWRGEVDSDEKIRRRVEHDLYYIENWSVLMDLYICLATPVQIIKQENAF